MNQAKVLSLLGTGCRHTDARRVISIKKVKTAVLNHFVNGFFAGESLVSFRAFSDHASAQSPLASSVLLFLLGQVVSLELNRINLRPD